MFTDKFENNDAKAKELSVFLSKEFQTKLEEDAKKQIEAEKTLFNHNLAEVNKKMAKLHNDASGYEGYDFNHVLHFKRNDLLSIMATQNMQQIQLLGEIKELLKKVVENINSGFS